MSGLYRFDVITGDAPTAYGWVDDSALSVGDKAALRSFIDHFPGLTFYHESAAELDAIEADLQITLPRWLRTLRLTLTFVMHEHQSWVRFAQSRHPTISSKELQEQWYTINLFGSPSSTERAFFARMSRIRPYPMGYRDTPAESALAINLADHTDKRVYDYSILDLLDAGLDSPRLDELVMPMFDSYPEMLSQIAAIKLIGAALDGSDDDNARTIVEALQ